MVYAHWLCTGMTTETAGGTETDLDTRPHKAKSRPVRFVTRTDAPDPTGSSSPAKVRCAPQSSRRAQHGPVRRQHRHSARVRAQRGVSRGGRIGAPRAARPGPRFGAVRPPGLARPAAHRLRLEPDLDRRPGAAARVDPLQPRADLRRFALADAGPARAVPQAHRQALQT